MNQFDVYIVDFDPARGSEMKKTGPAVIISPDAMNKNLNTVIVAPLTHTIKRYPSRVTSLFKGEPGQVALDQMKTVYKSELKQKQGRLPVSTARAIKTLLQAMFS